MYALYDTLVGIRLHFWRGAKLGEDTSVYKKRCWPSFVLCMRAHRKKEIIISTININ